MDDRETVREVVHHLMAVSTETQVFFRVTAQAHGLSPVEGQVVYDLAGGPRSLTVLAHRVGVQKGNLTAVVDRLEDRALLTRHAATGDRRVRELALTEQGHQLAQTFIRHLVDDAPITARLTAQDLRTLSALLRKARTGPSHP